MARRRRRHGHGRGLAIALLVLLIAAGAVGAVVHWLDVTHPAPVVAVCVVVDGSTTWRLAPDQADNAAVIAAVAGRRGLPAHAVTVALATALQESGLRNLDHGDRDSLGLFQQRPSQSWGSPEEVMDPIHATNAFYDRLVAVPNWQTIPVTKAAQAVQRSALPDAYANHEAGARAFASALTGGSTSTLTCTLDKVPSTSPGTDTAPLMARVQRDWGQIAVEPVAGSPGAVNLDGRALGGADQAGRLGWSLGQWAVATASTQRIVSVQVGDRRWTRGHDGWTTVATTVPDGTAVVTVG